MRGPFRPFEERGGALQPRRFMDGHAAETIARDGIATVKGSWHDTAAQAGWRGAKFSSMVA